MMRNWGPIDIKIIDTIYLMILEGIGFYTLRATSEGMEYFDRY